jgi:hypothetical protein
MQEFWNPLMVSILHPTQIILAFQLDKKNCKTIKSKDQYDGICECFITNQSLNIGEIADIYLDTEYKVVYHYSPKIKLLIP